MITREEISIAITSCYGLDLTRKESAILEIINAEQAKYQALVDAAVAYCGRAGKLLTGSDGAALMDAVNQFIPQPLLSEKLDAFAESFPIGGPIRSDAKRLADEARELEK